MWLKQLVCYSSVRHVWFSFSFLESKICTHFWSKSYNKRSHLFIQKFSKSLTFKLSLCKQNNHVYIFWQWKDLFWPSMQSTHLSIHLVMKDFEINITSHHIHVFQRLKTLSELCPNGHRSVLGWNASLSDILSTFGKCASFQFLRWVTHTTQLHSECILCTDHVLDVFIFSL